MTRAALIAIAVVLAGCAAEAPPAPSPEQPAAEIGAPEPEVPLKPFPQGRKLLEQLPTAVQVRECARRVPVNLDLGGWELRQWPLRDTEDPIFVELLYAVRGDEVRLMGRRDDLACLVERWRSADDLKEFEALIAREAVAGIEIFDGVSYPRWEEDAKPAEDKSAIKTTVVHKGDTCVAERPLFQTESGKKRVVQLREVFAPHSYSFEIVQVEQDIPMEDEFHYSPQDLKREGTPIETNLRPGGWQLWTSLLDPSGREEPAASALFALKGDEVRTIRRMDELAALAGPIDSGADAAELCQIPARLAATCLLAFEEDHGHVPDGEWDYLPASARSLEEPSFESIPGGWAVERLAIQYAGVGQCFRAVVIRQTFRDGHVRSEVVRIVKTLIPLLRAYQ